MEDCVTGVTGKSVGLGDAIRARIPAVLLCSLWVSDAHDILLTLRTVAPAPWLSSHLFYERLAATNVCALAKWSSEKEVVASGTRESAELLLANLARTPALDGTV